MNASLLVWKSGRESLARLIGTFTPGQLNHIPPGYSNNVAWNLGHMIVVQQSLVYRLSGLKMRIPDHLYDLYKPGTRPAEPVSDEDLEALKKLITSTVESTLADHEAGIAGPFKSITTSRGFQLANLDQALAFNNFHEGLHTGTIVSLARFF